MITRGTLNHRPWKTQKRWNETCCFTEMKLLFRSLKSTKKKILPELSSLGQLTNTRRTDGGPEPDGVLRTVARAKIRHYRQLYINRPEPIAFMPVAVDTTGRIYEDFSRLLFRHVNRETSTLVNEIPEESEQFRFLRAACFANIKGSAFHAV